MTADLYIALWCFGMAVIVMFFQGCEPDDEITDDRPDGSAGDLLADEPAEVLVSDEQVRQLERVWLL